MTYPFYIKQTVSKVLNRFQHGKYLEANILEEREKKMVNLLTLSWLIGIPYSIKQLGDNCIQTFHMGRYIVRYTVRNLFLKQIISGAVKLYFLPYIDDISPQMKILNMVKPIIMHQ